MNDPVGGIDEGVIKYSSDWTIGPPPDAAGVRLLNRWRAPLLAAGLIGHYDKFDVGFGNISIRARRPNQFIISGSQTGLITETSGEHYTLVTAVDFAQNRVESFGPIQASSEALTHAAIYRLSETINAVVHVHSHKLWMREQNRLPTTRADVPYGTPAMAEEFERLWRTGTLPEVGLAVMAGHDEGLVSIAATLEEAATRILALNQAS